MPDHDKPIVPSEDRLPIDPQTAVPDGYTEADRDRPGGFTGDPDVMDTWATASLTPQLIAGWPDDEALWRALYPMDLRPQAHEIIRTWLFDTLLRAPPRSTDRCRGERRPSAVSSPTRIARRCPSRWGNVVTPIQPLIEYGSDAVRYWAATGRPGRRDVRHEPDAGRPAAGDEDPQSWPVRAVVPTSPIDGAPAALDGAPSAIDRAPAPLDAAMLAALDDVTAEATAALDDLRLRPGAGHDRAVLLDVLRRLRGAGQGPGVRRRRLGAGRSPSGALDTTAAAARAVPAVRDRGSVVVVAGRFGARGGLAGGRRRWRRRAVFEAASDLVAAIRRAKPGSMRTEVAAVSISADTPGLEHLADAPGRSARGVPRGADRCRLIPRRLRADRRRSLVTSQ